MFWVEVRPRQMRIARPWFVTLEQLKAGDYVGFRSVYAYPEEVKNLITTNGGTAGLEGQSVFSDMLFVDFDNTDPSELLYFLYDEGVRHEVWASGNRSTHVHVRCEAMFGPDVPWSQKKWVEAHAPGADLTFYHAAGQFRLPRTVHEKTGQRKTFVQGMAGRYLSIPTVARPLHTPGKQARSGIFHSHLLVPKAEGGRRVYVWHLAKQALAEGLTIDVALDGILWWNSRHCTPPLEETVVRSRVSDVYRRAK